MIYFVRSPGAGYDARDERNLRKIKNKYNELGIRGNYWQGAGLATCLRKDFPSNVLQTILEERESVGSPYRKVYHWTADVPAQMRRSLLGYAVSLRTRSPSFQWWLNMGRTCNVSLGYLGTVRFTLGITLGIDIDTSIVKCRLFIAFGIMAGLTASEIGMQYQGLIMAMTGVALLELGEIYNTSLSAISQLITTRCVGVLAGSLIGGKLYDTYNTQVISILTIGLSSFTALAIPLSGYLAVAHIAIFFEGFSWGAFGTGANVWIMKMWPENSSPALQVFHLTCGVGYLMAPLISQPFMSTQTGDTENSTTTVTGISFNSTEDLDVVSLNTTLVKAPSSRSTIYYAYAIASAYQLIIVASMTILYFIDKTNFKTRRTNVVNNIGENMQQSAEYKRFAQITLILLCAYMMGYTALQTTTSQMLTAFAVKCDLRFSKLSASRLAAVYFLCFAAGRLAAAIFTVKVSAFSVLVASHVVLVATASLLLAWGSKRDHVLWAVSALMGLAQGPLNGAVTAWVAKRINIINRMMSIVVVAVAPGFLSPPLLVGQFLDTTPDVFLYVSFAAVVVSTTIFIGMCFYLSKRCIISAHKQLNQKNGNVEPDAMPSSQAASDIIVRDVS